MMWLHRLAERVTRQQLVRAIAARDEARDRARWLKTELDAARRLNAAMAAELAEARLDGPQ